MQIEINPVSETPLYQQLRDRMVEAIADGSLKPGDPLASVRRVAVEFGINVATVGKGYDMLRREGLVRTNRRSGSIVARGPGTGAPPTEFVEAWGSRLRTLLSEAAAQGMTAGQIESRSRRVLAEFEPARAQNRRENQ